MKPWLGILAGPPGAGKTHMALSACRDMPMYLADTEDRSDWILQNRFGNYSNRIQVFPTDSWNDLKTMGRKIATDGALDIERVVVIDSGSALQELAEQEVIQANKKVLNQPWFSKWGKIFDLIEDYISAIMHKLNCHVVLTSMMKPVYENNEDTGKIVPRLNNRFLHKADFIAEWNEQKYTWIFTKSLWSPKYDPWTIKCNIRTDSLIKIVESLKDPQVLEGGGHGFKPKVN